MRASTGATALGCGSTGRASSAPEFVESAVSELYMITGAAGSGKTTTGLALAERLGCVWLDLDDATESLVREYLLANPDVTEPQALSALRPARYRLLSDCARARWGSDPDSVVVLIAPFTAEVSSPERWADWLGELGVAEDQAHLVWLAISPAERLRRLAARGESRDAEAVAGGSLPEPITPAVPALVLDAGLGVEQQVDLVLQRFGNA